MRVLLCAAVLRSGAFPNALTLLARLGSPVPSRCALPSPVCGGFASSGAQLRRAFPAGALRLRGALEASSEDGAPMGLPPAQVEPGARVRLPQYLHATLPDVFPSLSSARCVEPRAQLFWGLVAWTCASRVLGHLCHRRERLCVILDSEMCSGSEVVSYLRLIDSCITQLKA